MKVLRKSDRVKFKVDGIEFIIAPLPYRDRIELSTLVRHSSGEVKLDWIEQTSQIVKKCLKGISGLKDFHGNDYALVFNEVGDLEDVCIDEVLGSLGASNATGAIIYAANRNTAPLKLSEKEGDFLEFTVLGK